jgi:hypothetical protein
MDRDNLRYVADCDRKAAEARRRGEIVLAEKSGREAESGRFWAPKHHQLVLTFERAATRPWEPLPTGVQVSYREPPPTAAELLALWLTRRGLPILIVIIAVMHNGIAGGSVRRKESMVDGKGYTARFVSCLLEAEQTSFSCFMISFVYFVPLVVKNLLQFGDANQQ